MNNNEENTEKIRVRYILSNIEHAHIKVDLLKIATQISSTSAENVVEIARKLEDYIWSEFPVKFAN